MVVTDLDGTLLDSSGRLAAENRDTLVELGQAGWLRVVATGRSLYSAEQVLTPDTPIDYLVFSSGAGILDWCRRTLILARDMTAEQVRTATACMLDRRLDFMLHAPIPDNHRFLFHPAGNKNPDFERRIARYERHAEAWNRDWSGLGPMSQLLAILPAWDAECYRAVAEDLSSLSVIRTTSPLDGRSLWIEVFSKEVSKATAAAWLAARAGLDRADVLVIGNDYNDLSLLEWGGMPFVVRNAALPLRERYPVVDSNERAGFSEAVRSWLRRET